MDKCRQSSQYVYMYLPDYQSYVFVSVLFKYIFVFSYILFIINVPVPFRAFSLCRLIFLCLCDVVLCSISLMIYFQLSTQFSPEAPLFIIIRTMIYQISLDKVAGSLVYHQSRITVGKIS